MSDLFNGVSKSSCEGQERLSGFRILMIDYRHSALGLSASVSDREMMEDERSVEGGGWERG